MAQRKKEFRSFSAIDLWRQLRRKPLAFLGLLVVLAIALACFCAPWVTDYSYIEQDLDMSAMPPSSEHPFGTDMLGRDLLSRVLYGGRISFMVGLVASAVSLLIGVTYGAISGWYGGNLDRLMMRCVEIVYSLPYTIFVITLMVFIGRGLTPLFLAIGAVEWLTMARLIRGQVMLVKEQPFVQAAHTLGQGNTETILRHIIPNVMGTIIICLTLTIPNVMILESFISFLGLGVQAPMTSWGDLIKEGVSAMETCPWMLIFPSLFFSATLFSLNFLGDGLRDALDPRAAKA